MANQQADAKVTVLNGKAYAERNGTRITLTEGADIYASDTIITDSSSGVEVVFRDNAVIKLGPGSQVAVQDFVYDGESNPSFAVQLVTGVMTSLSGEVVKQNPAAFKISTPRATIGIRGTETYHSVQGETETHAVVHISQGHIVMLNSSDGQAITLGSAMQAVTLNESGRPLTIRTFQPNEMDKLQDALSGMGKKAPVQDGPPEQEAPQTPNTGEEGGQEAAAPQSVATSTVVQEEIRVLVVAEAGTEATVALVQDALQAAQDTTGIIIESPVISPIGTDAATDAGSAPTLSETLVADNPVTPPADFVPPPQEAKPEVPPSPEPPTVLNSLVNTSYTAGDGNDTINVGTMQNATLNAGAGDDSITINQNLGGNTVNGGAGFDVLHIDAGGAGGPAGAVTITGVEAVYGTNAFINLGNAGENVSLHGVRSVTGGSGNDTITVADTDYLMDIKGGDGNDFIGVTNTVNLNPNKIIEGGAGNDTIDINNKAGSAFTIDGGAGQDEIVIRGDPFSGTVYGGGGSDSITIDVLQAKAGNTTLISGEGLGVTAPNSDTGTGTDHIIIKHIAAGDAGALATVRGGHGDDTFTLGTWDNGTTIKLDATWGSGNTDRLVFSEGATQLAGSASGVDYKVDFMNNGQTLTIIFEGMSEAQYNAFKNAGYISGL